MRVKPDKLKSVVADIIKKYPKGPNGSFKKHDYNIVRQWSNPYGRYVNKSILKSDFEYSKFYGYTPEVIWQILEGDFTQANAKRLICEVFPGMSRVSISRRANRLYARTLCVREHLKECGTSGTFQIQWDRYSSDKVFVHAASVAEATATATMLAGLFGYDITERTYVNFIDIETKEKTAERNQETVERKISSAQYRLNTARERVVKAEKELEEVEKEVNILLTAASMHEETMNVSN